LIHSRRDFLKTSGALLAAGGVLHAAPDWKKQVGLELYTVRDLLTKDFEGTIAKVAELGYKEVEPTGYGGLDPKQFRALLDKYKLTAPSTHLGVTAGPNVEKELEGHQIMGFKYTEVRGGGGGGAGRGAAAPAPLPRPRQSVEAVKRSAAQYNEHGKLTRKFGMKILIHNHTQEFELLDDGKTTQYDVLLAETDPSLVALQLDIGWASVAGQNILQIFQKNPGRYELWHVKDAVGMKDIDPTLTPDQRRPKTRLVPVGQGEVNYKAIFAKASQAGLKHYAIEQDNAAEGGDAMAATKASIDGLRKMLS
jgi:sugar phosphate isomerase/epimerase